jgi:glycosyltransferase 2 family protein
MHWKKIVFQILRWAVPAAIIAWLVIDATRKDSFAKLRDQPKHWDLLLLATVLCFAAVVLTMIRWMYLVRALDIPFRLRDALRLGFLGYLLNFISPGSVGGDLFKAVFLARACHGRRAEAAVTVVVDRLIGLYALFLVGMAAIFATGMWRSDSPQVRVICNIVFWCTGIGTAMLLIAALPGFSHGPIARRLHALPRVGHIIERINRANRLYYSRVSVLVMATAMSLVVHSLSAIGVWLIARAVLSDAPSLGAHFVIVPLAMATGAIPLAPNGLGTFEVTVEFLYQHLPSGGAAFAGAGFVVALGYRLITVLIAMIGAGVYVASRREMSDVLHEAEDIADEDDALDNESTAAIAKSDPIDADQRKRVAAAR